MQGEPLVNIRGNHLQRGINYTRKPPIYGNSCKVNALFNKGAHPRPSLFEESSVHLKISKPKGKPKKPKQPKRSRQKLSKTIEKTKKQRNQNFQTHVGQSGHGSESFLFYNIFICTLDSSKWLGRGCAPLLNKAFTLHAFPCIRGFLV